LEKAETVAYLDFEDGVAVARYHKEEQAANVVTFFASQKMKVKGSVITPTLMQGEEEKKYWDKVEELRVSFASHACIHPCTADQVSSVHIINQGYHMILSASYILRYTRVKSSLRDSCSEKSIAQISDSECSNFKLQNNISCVWLFLHRNNDC